MPRSRFLSLSLICLIVACATTPSAGASGLHILLTNDDGYGSVGLETLKEALRGAGHRVTVVAPEGNRSGSSASMTFGAIRVVEQAPGEYSADGTPATCALLGLTAFEDPEDPFDLLVSGTNAGANAGGATGISGTVGATTAAVGIGGMPAIAVSANEVGKEGEPGHRKHFEETAALAVRVIDRLTSTAGDGPLLPPGTRLNVNVPGIPWSEIQGVRHSVQGRGVQFGLGFEEKAPGVYAPAFRRPKQSGADVERSDVAALAEGFAAVVLLDADYTAASNERASVESRLGDL
ncbi:MAG: 5'/3'-nucleotidase SurE [Myxococcota bacterium]